MMGENFILKWNDHSSSVLKAASLLFNSSGLTDVTIGTSDKTFKAHKLVLSICSTSFASLFSVNGALGSQTNPFIYMQDTPSRHIEDLLKYMYNGEVSVEETELVHLLHTAKSLGVKGLCEVDNTQNDSPPPARKRAKKLSTSELDRKPKQTKNVVITEMEDEVIEVEPKLQTDNIIEQYDDIVEEENESHESIIPEDWYGTENYPDESMEDDSSVEKGLACAYCPKVFASNWHLKRHVLTHTKENRFRCDVCCKDFSRNDNLKSHMRSIHGVYIPPKQKSLQS